MWRFILAMVVGYCMYAATFAASRILAPIVPNVILFWVSVGVGGFCCYLTKGGK